MNYILTFLEGVASFLSPCVLPMLPIYISYFAGKDSKKTKTLTNSIAFVLGFSTIFIILAFFSNKIGNTISNYIKYLKIIFGIIVVILGMNYLEIFHLKIFTKSQKYNINIESMNFIKTFFFGLLFSISMTPCVGTFFSSALLLIASEESMAKGFLLIILYCLGLGIPFIISSILLDRLKSFFGFIKKNYRIVKGISGSILIIMGIYMMVK